MRPLELQKAVKVEVEGFQKPGTQSNKEGTVW
jgi:hypothetical protein